MVIIIVIVIDFAHVITIVTDIVLIVNKLHSLTTLNSLH